MFSRICATPGYMLGQFLLWQVLNFQHSMPSGPCWPTSVHVERAVNMDAEDVSWAVVCGVTGHVYSLHAWSSCMFISGSQDKTARLWDLRAPAAVNVIPSPSPGLSHYIHRLHLTLVSCVCWFYGSSLPAVLWHCRGQQEGHLACKSWSLVCHEILRMFLANQGKPTK